MRILFIVYDNGSYVHTFPIGIAYLASALRKKGHDITIYNQDLHHYPDEHLTAYLDNNPFDMVGLGVIGGYYQYAKLLQISRAVNTSKNRPAYYILGGHGPSPEPEYFLKKTGADIVVIGEGEETIVELTDAILRGDHLKTIKGIAYHDHGKTIITPKRPLIEDIDSIPWPAYDLFPIAYYRLIRMPHCQSTDLVMPVLSGRGCTFKCTFCYRMDKGYRPRHPESITEEIAFLQKQYGINYIDFADELLMSSKQRVVELCEAIIKSDLKFKWYCNGRLNYATPKALKLMKKAGCVFINYGIEAMDDAVLKNMKKGLTTGQIIKGIETTLSSGISPGLNIIFGNLGDNEETLRNGVEFLLKYDDCSELRTIRPVTPYPGSPLYYFAIEKGLLGGVEDFYENKHINSDLLAVNFTGLSDREFYKCLMNANTALIKNYYQKNLSRLLGATKNLYMNQDADFRGYRQV